MHTIRLLSVACALLVLAGCAKPVAGTAGPDERAATPLTAQAVFGDYRTVDYCSLVDRAALPDGIVGDSAAPVNSFDNCEFLRPGAGTRRGSLGEAALVTMRTW
ncbi:MAG TPA: hypothetical protein VFV67_05305 [Actinophytocola sp.]|uniref:hypothetical protein n=1 Tax=Actinophytocola sp. TaxID=1872138 RepID=UPI002DB85E54|nr:hypothetical protein [Actinophytocola sp.]HEU5470050.1 hypothetical protein [Actinophytocola sp.]